MKELKGFVRGVPTVITGEGKINTTAKNVRSILLINNGLVNVQIFEEPNHLIIEPGDSFVFGGYDDSNRIDDVPVKCLGVGRAWIMYDKQEEEPKIV